MEKIAESFVMKCYTEGAIIGFILGAATSASLFSMGAIASLSPEIGVIIGFLLIVVAVKIQRFAAAMKSGISLPGTNLCSTPPTESVCRKLTKEQQPYHLEHPSSKIRLFALEKLIQIKKIESKPESATKRSSKAHSTLWFQAI